MTNSALRTLTALLSLFLVWPLQAQQAPAAAYLTQHYKDFGLEPRDLSGLVVQDQYLSRHNRITHVYLAQTWEGIEVAGVQAAVHFDASGTAVAAHSSFIAGIAAKAGPAQPVLSARQAVQRAADYLGLPLPSPLVLLQEGNGPAQAQVFAADTFLLEPIPARLVWQPQGRALRLAWETRLYPPDAQHWWTLRVDARTGTILAQEDWNTHDHWPEPPVAATVPVGPPLPPPAPLSGPAYRVFPLPVESPIHGSRALVADPADPAASPYGWHDVNGVPGAEYTTTQGNNVDAYLDTANNNFAAPGSRADGGAGLAFDFPLDLGLAPIANRDAGLAQVFYAANVAHDILHRYGFDEPAGNFQQNNYGRGGSGGDPVRAEAQDGGATNSAVFSTPPDGFKPRMQLYRWTHTTPHRDGGLDNAIIIHEYAHGLSQRLTGGPASVFCLNHGEQMGEGWSDWLALMLTMQPGDAGTEARGLGTYGLAQAPDGPGIRPAPYSTDLAVNDFTYEDLKTLPHPYGTGFGWATVLWDLTWALIDAHGFDPDWYAGTGGNNIALQLVVDAMKLQPCQPGFVDARDAILLADELAYGGAHTCLIWETFARRGLGFSADQGSSQSRTDGVAAFDLPAACRKELQLTLTVTPDSAVAAGETLFFVAEVQNTKDEALTQVELSCPIPAGTTFVPGSASHGGSEQGGKVTFPGVALASGDHIERSFQVLVSSGQYSTEIFEDDHEAGPANWQASHALGGADWSLSPLQPRQGNFSWFAEDVAVVSDQYLTLASPVPLGNRPLLRFWHFFNTEAGISTAYDGGVVEISTDGGANWIDLGPQLSGQGYTHPIAGTYGNPLAGRAAFAGNSGGYVRTDADLTPYAGQNVLIRFRLGTDSSVGHVGWYIDEVAILELVNVQGTAWAVAAEGDSAYAETPAPGVLVGPPINLPVEWLDFRGQPWGKGIRLDWQTAGETGNAGFEVQRSAGINMDLVMPLGWVPGGGSVQEMRAYHFEDTLVRPGGTYHYRLRQVDLDGTAHLSPVVTVHLPYTGQVAFAAYPNPAQDYLYLSLTGDSGGSVRYELLDGLGRVRRQALLPKPATGGEWKIPLDGLRPGVYWLRLYQGAHTAAQAVQID